jgi:hypothetical protein
MAGIIINQNFFFLLLKFSDFSLLSLNSKIKNKEKKFTSNLNSWNIEGPKKKDGEGEFFTQIFKTAFFYFTFSTLVL